MLTLGHVRFSIDSKNVIRVYLGSFNKNKPFHRFSEMVCYSQKRLLEVSTEKEQLQSTAKRLKGELYRQQTSSGRCAVALGNSPG